jgi:phosphoribosylformylglycinamidine (FGAM) synthase-like enzyme
LKALYEKAAGALPPIDLDLEKRLQELLRRLIGEALPGCIHGLGDGGLAVALAESALLGGHGAEIALPGDPSPEGLLFGEGPTRVLLAVKEGSPEKRFLELARAARVPVILLGRSGGDRLRVAVGASTAIDLPLSRLRQSHEEATAWMQQ